jgi:hypothetical protein
MKCFYEDYGGFEFTMVNDRYLVTASLDAKEKALFETMVHSQDASCNLIMKRLIRYFIDGGIPWRGLFGKYDGLPVVDTPNMSRRKQVRTTLKPEHYSAFVQSVEECGSTTAIVVRRLIQLYISGKIKKGDIWY